MADDASVNFTVKELIVQLRADVVAGLERIDRKLDTKASMLAVADLQQRVAELERKESSAGAVGTYRGKTLTALLALTAAVIGGLAAHIHP